MFRMNTLFKYVNYHPQGHQILTTGTDRLICYWEVADGAAIRSLKGSETSINTLDITPCGCYFVSGGDDKMVKVFINCHTFVYGGFQSNLVWWKSSNFFLNCELSDRGNIIVIQHFAVPVLND